MIARNRRGEPPRSEALEPRSLEPWLWGLGIFLLTSPFVYQLTGVDPSVEVSRNLATMRREGGSGVLLYAIRYAVALAAIFFILPDWKAALGRLPRIWPMLAFIAWAALTILWSDTADSSINGMLALLPLVITGYCLALRLPPHLLARSYIYSGVWSAGFSLIYVVLLPHYGVHQHSDVAQSVHAGAWRGVYPHKNLFGGLMGAYAAITLLAGREVLRSQIFRFGFVAFLLLLIVKSHSATALLIAFAAPVLAWCLVTLRPAVQALLVLCIVPLVLGVVSQLDYLLGLLGRDLTFTGRTSIWEIAPATIAKRPLHGYGFASTAYGDFMVELYRRFGLFDPHNGYLNLVLSTGFIGFSLFIAAIVVSTLVARRLYREGGALRQGGLVIFGITSAWILAMLSESQDKPLGSFAALGFSAFALAVYRAGVRVTAPSSDDAPQPAPSRARRLDARRARRFAAPTPTSQL